MSSRGSAGRGLDVGRTVRLGEVLGLALGEAGLALGAARLVLVADGEGDGGRVGEDA
ncbi:hypothetical protein [Micromonospora sp. DT229]|uniref:hypothetical protein n=1 Tax=Micromonospora sp. DT229 TaxID=3393430 RepID=UPI003CF9CF50